MNTERATDEVTDSIAHIEMHRQDAARETGLAAACNEALRKLHELLEQERALLQQHGPGAAHEANIEAVAAAISKVKNLAGAGNSSRPASRPQSRGQQQPQRKGPRGPDRHRGRRTMGRRGDR